MEKKTNAPPQHTGTTVQKSIMPRFNPAMAIAGRGKWGIEYQRIKKNITSINLHSNDLREIGENPMKISSATYRNLMKFPLTLYLTMGIIIYD
jgi:hypothetical protein